MPLLSRKTLKSPALAFFAYVAAGCLILLAYRGFLAGRVLPGEAAPLPIFERSWWRTLWLIDVVALFPALALSALVVPFGMGFPQEAGRSPRFSADLFRRCFMVPIATAIVAAAIYAALFFLALPLAQHRERGMRFDAEVYLMAVERAGEYRDAGEWAEASRFVGIFEGIWPENPENAGLLEEVEVQLARERAARPAMPGPPGGAGAASGLPGLWGEMTAAGVMELAREAYGERRLFDAHWLASVSRGLAAPGSPDAADAARLAASAWNQIERQVPTGAELRAREMFRLKLDGYNAMVAGDYARAFYVFQEHARLDPGNPDVENFLEHSERRLRDTAFFTDEMRLNKSIGRTLAGVVFSLPAEPGGRAVMRLDSLSFTSDAAFGAGFEYMLFDRGSRLVLHLRAPYARFAPFSVGGPEARRGVYVILRALDRGDPEARWEPSIEFSAEPPLFHGGGIALGIDYETFLALSRMRHDVPAMHLAELFLARGVAAEAGHVPQVFEAEILRRLGSGLFLLPAAIAAIAAAWYFRARRIPQHYLFVPLLFIMPLVFNGIAHAIRAGLDLVGVALALALGFPAALLLFSAILALAFVCSLLILAAQKSE